MLLYTANLLKECVEVFGQNGDFVGHVGGDDFIVITNTKNTNRLCHEITSRFDHEILRIYPQSKEYIETPQIVTDRMRKPIGSTRIAISLAVLECSFTTNSDFSLERISEEAGYLKKRVKDIRGSASIHGKL